VSGGGYGSVWEVGRHPNRRNYVRLSALLPCAGRASPYFSLGVKKRAAAFVTKEVAKPASVYERRLPDDVTV
jgi:hypothetical protein